MKRAELTARRAVFARQARGRFDAHERQLRPAVDKAIGQYLAVLRRRVAQHGGTLLAAAAQPDPGQEAALAKLFTAQDAGELADMLEGAGEEWAPILDGTLMPAYRGLLGTISDLAGDHPAVVSAMQTWRDDWLTSRRQVLLGVPDTIAGNLRTNLSDLAGADGTDPEAAREQVQAMLDDGYPQWAGRGELIARTETVGANNQGGLAGWSAMADAAGVSHVATKSWLATEDERTRESHAELDGTTIGIAEMFDVGGTPMNGPGDPNGDAGEVCNCRCTLTYDVPDEATGPDGQPADGELPADGQGETDAMTAASSDGAGGNTSACLMLGVAAGDAQRIALDGGDPPSLMHVTLALLARPAADYSPEQRAQVELNLSDALAGQQLPLTADAWAIAHFNPASPEREPCAVLLVQSPQLASVHDSVTAALTALDGVDESDTFPVWTPHVTVGYGLVPADVPPEALGPLSLDRLIMAWGDDQTVILGPPDPLTAAASETPVTTPVAPPPAPDSAAPPPPAQSAPAVDQDLTPKGQTWSGCLALLDTPSSDGRIVKSGGLIIRPLPQTLNWQRESDEQHKGNVVVGRVLAVEERDGMVWGSGDYLDPMMCYDAQQAMSLVDAGVGMVSLDLIPQEVSFATRDGQPVDPMFYDGDPADVVMSYDLSEFGGVTILNFAAFADARIHNDPLTSDEASEQTDEVIYMPGVDGTFDAAAPGAPVIAEDGSSITLTDGTVVKVGDTVAFPDADGADGDVDTGTITAIDADAQTVAVALDPDDDDPNPEPQTVPVGDLTPAGTPVDDAAGGDMALLAASITRPYPRSCFARRQLPGPTPLTINEDTGEVFGHAGQWDTPHHGKLQEGLTVLPPRSKCGYQYFHTGGPVRLDDGSRLPVGKLTVGGGHYYGRGGYRAAVEHYDRTSAVFAVVRAYEDKFGIQVAGHLVHGVKRETVEAALISGQLSGDWRELGTDNNLEMCAAHCVVEGGFPMTRPQPKLGFDPSGHQVSLVAAGVVQRTVHAEGIRLASGSLVTQREFDQLVASAVASFQRSQVSAADQLAARRRRAEALRVSLDL